MRIRLNSLASQRTRARLRPVYCSLRGYCNLNSHCKREYAKRLFGKYSSLKPSYLGDMVNLCRFVHVDRNLTVTGRLPRIGNDSKTKLKPFVTDPKFVIRVLLYSIDKDEQCKDIERLRNRVIGKNK